MLTSGADGADSNTFQFTQFDVADDAESKFEALAAKQYQHIDIHILQGLFEPKLLKYLVKQRQVQTLNLRNVPINRSNLKYLETLFKRNSLTQIRISAIPMPDQMGTRLLQALKPSESLEDIEFYSMNFKDSDLPRLVGFIESHPKLRQVSLIENSFGFSTKLQLALACAKHGITICFSANAQLGLNEPSSVNQLIVNLNKTLVNVNRNIQSLLDRSNPYPNNFHNMTIVQADILQHISRAEALANTIVKKLKKVESAEQSASIKQQIDRKLAVIKQQTDLTVGIRSVLEGQNEFAKQHLEHCISDSHQLPKSISYKFQATKVLKASKAGSVPKDLIDKAIRFALKPQA